MSLSGATEAHDAAVGLPPGATDQPPSFAFFVGFAQLRRSDAANTPARDVSKLETGAHQNVGDFHDLDRRVDAVNVSGGIGFSNAKTLRFRNCFVNALPCLHGFEDRRWWSS